MKGNAARGRVSLREPEEAVIEWKEGGASPGELRRPRPGAKR